jgi:hypothetical protein
VTYPPEPPPGRPVPKFDPFLPAQPPQRPKRKGLRILLLGAGSLIAVIAVAAVLPGSHAKAPAAATALASRPPASAEARPSPSPPCKLKVTFDYLVRTTEPGLAASADEIGNVDLSDCTPTLQDFAQTAGQAQGECTAIALASDNPGYNPDASPALPLRKVIKKAGPGC